MGKAPKLPWFVYYEEPLGLSYHYDSGDVYADDSNYAKLPRFNAELYMKDYDTDVIEAFEAAIHRLAPFRSDEAWVESENCFMRSYNFVFFPNNRKETDNG